MRRVGTGSSWWWDPRGCWHAAAGFEISFALAPRQATGQYLGVFGLGAGLAEAAGPALIIFLCITWGRALTGLAAPSPSAGHGPGTPPGSRSTKTSRRSPPPRPEALG
ncbi:hypothetical protein [Streptomyces sp. NPDC085665]|uniref:hypothetical protein n=1 Tax=Streptomyces sp. NPDC085665 TaxID=3365735 RepID=UPI0037D5AA7E